MNNYVDPRYSDPNYNPIPEPLPTQGIIRQGTIMPGTRIPVMRDDIGPGAYSTVDSVTFGDGQGPYRLIHTTADDGSRMLTRDEVLARNRDHAGPDMGLFRTEGDANRYAQAFHNMDAYLYDNGLDLPAYIQKSTGIPVGGYKRPVEQGLMEKLLYNNGLNIGV